MPSPLQASHPSRLSSSQEPHIRKLPPPLPQLPPLLLHDLTCSKHQQSSLLGLLLNFCYEVPLCYEVPFPVHPFLVPLRLLESPTEAGLADSTHRCYLGCVKRCTLVWIP